MRVRIYKIDFSDYLDIDAADNTYMTRITGLWDLPSREILASQGYAGGAVFAGARRSPRQFSMETTIEAGMAASSDPRNALHNAARDALIRFLPDQQEIWLETEYPGSDPGEFWRIKCYVQQMPYPDRTGRKYTSTLIAQDPILYSSVVRSQVVVLPFNKTTVSTSSNANPTTITTGAPHGLVAGDRVKITGHSVSALNGLWFTVASAGTSTFVIPVASTGGSGGQLWTDYQNVSVPVLGNTFTRPSIQIVPNLPKPSRWNWSRQYTVTNNSAYSLSDYPVLLPFDFDWHRALGRIKDDGSDIRVIANGIMSDRWFANLPGSYRSPVNISAIGTGTPFSVTTATAHGLATGQRVRFVGTTTTPSTVEAYLVATVVDSTHFTCTGMTITVGQGAGGTITGGAIDGYEGIWAYLDILPGETVNVHVIHGHAVADPWVNGTNGPAFERDRWSFSGNTYQGSNNAAWIYYGRFMARPVAPVDWGVQWNIHNRQQRAPNGESLMVPFQTRVGGAFTTHNLTPFSPTNAAGGYALTGYREAGFAGLAIHHPIGFSGVNFAGQQLARPQEAYLVLRARDPDTGALTIEWDNSFNIVLIEVVTIGLFHRMRITTDRVHGLAINDKVYVTGVTGGSDPMDGTYTVNVINDTLRFEIVLYVPTPGTGGRFYKDTTGGFDPIGTPSAPWVVNFAATKEAVVFALARPSGYAIATVNQQAGIDWCKLIIDSPNITVAGAAYGSVGDVQIYMMDGSVTNSTTGESIYLFGEVTNTDSVGDFDTVLVDMDNQLISMNLAPFYYAFSMNSPVRSEWMRLLPGSNTMRVRDADTEGITFTLNWLSCRY